MITRNDLKIFIFVVTINLAAWLKTLLIHNLTVKTNTEDRGGGEGEGRGWV